MLQLALKYFRVRTRNFLAVILNSYSDCKSSFFGHNTDPKKTKSINRFRKDTFIPNKQTEGLVNLLHTQVHLSKSLVLEHEWYHKQKLSQSWFIYFPGHLQAIGRNKMLPQSPVYQTQESSIDTRLIVIALLIVTKVNYFTSVTIIGMSALV